MAQMQHLVSFVQTAEHGSFSAAARVLGLTPAGVSKNVARLERDLGVRLFHRSTRRLALTESGERFLQPGRRPAGVAAGGRCGRGDVDEDAGGHAEGQHGPGVRPQLPAAAARRLPRALSARGARLALRQPPVDLVGEGFDAAIGGGFRAGGRRHRARVGAGAHRRCRIARLHGGPGAASHPGRPGILRLHHAALHADRPSRPWTLGTRRATKQTVQCQPRLILSDPEAVAQAARLGLGVALLPMPFAFARIASGELVRLLPGLVQRRRPAVAVLPEQADAAGEDPGLRRLRGRALPRGGVRAARGWSMTALAAPPPLMFAAHGVPPGSPAARRPGARPAQPATPRGLWLRRGPLERGAGAEGTPTARSCSSRRDSLHPLDLRRALRAFDLERVAAEHATPHDDLGVGGVQRAGAVVHDLPDLAIGELDPLRATSR